MFPLPLPRPCVQANSLGATLPPRHRSEEFASLFRLPKTLSCPTEKSTSSAFNSISSSRRNPQAYKTASKAWSRRPSKSSVKCLGENRSSICSLRMTFGKCFDVLGRCICLAAFLSNPTFFHPMVQKGLNGTQLPVNRSRGNANLCLIGDKRTDHPSRHLFQCTGLIENLNIVSKCQQICSIGLDGMHTVPLLISQVIQEVFYVGFDGHEQLHQNKKRSTRLGWIFS